MAMTTDKGPQPHFERLRPKRSYMRRRKRVDVMMRVLIYAAFIIALIPLISVLWTTISRGIVRLNGYFLTHSMQGVVGGRYPYGGILNAMIGTLEITVAAIVISVPIGLMTSIYLVEYSRQGKLYTAISFFIDVMSGIPSIVAGLFAYALFSLIFGPGTMNGFVGAVALSLLMIPTVVRSCEEMLKIVPNDLREAAYGLGVSKNVTIRKVVLRTALPGIISGVLLAIARVIGETAPLLITAGAIDATNLNLFSGHMTALPVYVFDQYSQGLASCGPDTVGANPPCVPGIRMERTWAAALTLIIIVLVLNLIGRLISRYLAAKES